MCAKIKAPYHFVIQNEAKDLENILYVIEILPTYGRLNDNTIDLYFGTSTSILLLA